MVSITTKALKSDLKLRLARFENLKFSYLGKVDISSPGPYPLQPWPSVPWHIGTKYAIVVPYFNLLYRALYGFNYY